MRSGRARPSITWIQAASSPMFSKPWTTSAGAETQSQRPSTVSARWPAPSSKKTFTLPSRTKNTSSTSWRWAALPCPGGTNITLSVMFVPPGQGNAAHRHEVEEVFFVLEGKVKVFFEDGAGHRAETVLGRWDCVSAPADVVHGFENIGLEAAWIQVMLGRARPDLMSYADPGLQAKRDAHLGATRA